MTDVRQPKPFGDEQLETLAMELAWGILEHMAGLFAGEQDDPRFVNDERGVRRLREDTFKGYGGKHPRLRSISQLCVSLDQAEWAREYVEMAME
jgi:hypothetical protein